MPTHMQTESARKRRLEGKRILITAGASGMGRAGAELFAQEGAVICIADYDTSAARDAVAAIRSAGGQAEHIQADLTDMEVSRRIVDQANEIMGGLDAFWAHAGAPGPKEVEGINWDGYRRSMALNVDTAVSSVGQAIPYLRRGNKPAILFTASTAGLTGSPFSPTYSLAKFAVVGLMKSLALSLAPENIRANALCPGLTDTPMLPVFMSRAQDPVAQVEAQKRFVQNIPLGRISQPIEQAHAALWLLSDDASFVTGVALPVDGGFTAK